MISKERMFIVAGNIDDSIKSVTPVYDISIFPDFIKFEEYINTTPIVLGSIVISEKELPFTSTNMARLLDLLSAPFLKLTGSCIYLISETTSSDAVSSFLEDNGITTITFYQGDLSSRFISDIVSGAARIADESETEVITYRMRASEYAVAQNIKKYETDENDYETDEEQLSAIPQMAEPEIQIPSVDILSSTYYVVGKQSVERTLFTFIEAQYLALTGKTLIVESDIQYHRLTDMVLKSSVDYEFIDLEEFMVNPTKIVQDIKASSARLIVIGCKNRIIFNYDFVFDILSSNLLGYVDYFIKECDFTQTPYGSYYSIVCADTVPDVLECCNSLLYDVDPTKVILVGMRMNKKNECNITSTEMTDIVRVVLDKSNLIAEVVEANGINLRGEEIVYDVFSIISRGNERQG
jgi:CRISPR/Cas system-associated endoribonuclease Cas2